MSKKVVAINYGFIHYHAGCSGGCDFTDAINTGRNAAAVRRAVLKHVRETGHECWIEAGKHTSYRLEAVEHSLHPTLGILPLRVALSTPQHYLHFKPNPRPPSAGKASR